MTRLEAVVGDLVSADTEAIVNAANSQLWMGGGVAGAIKAAAGDAVEHEAMALGPIEPGQAIVTSAGNLPAPIRWVVHAATMGPDLQTSESYIRGATASAMRAAERAGARSVALPALGTGVGGFSLERAARVMIEEARRVVDEGTSLERIVFVLRSDEVRQTFDDVLRTPP